MQFKYRSPFAHLVVSQRSALECAKSDHRIDTKLRCSGWLNRCIACASFNTFPLHTFCQVYLIKGRLSVLFAYYFVRSARLPLSCGPFGINLILAPSISRLFVTEECDRRFHWHKQVQRGVGRPSSSSWNWNQMQLLNDASVERTSFRVAFFSYFKIEPQPNGFAQLKQLFT